MSRKDYELLAKAFRRCVAQMQFTPGDHFAVNKCIHEVANALWMDNTRFNKQRFLAVCDAGLLVKIPPRPHQPDESGVKIKIRARRITK